MQWPLTLACAGSQWAPPRQQRAIEASSSLGGFELLDRTALEHVTSVRGKARPPPLSKEEWGTFFNAAGGHSHGLVRLWHLTFCQDADCSLQPLRAIALLVRVMCNDGRALSTRW